MGGVKERFPELGDEGLGSLRMAGGGLISGAEAMILGL